MGNFLRVDGSLMGFLTKVSDVCLISFLWLLCCLPVVTIGASTTAAYYTIVKVVKRQRGTMLREFFHSFKDNFMDSFIINLIYLLVEGILAFNIYSSFQSLETGTAASFNFLFLYVALFLLMIGLSLHTYAALSRFVMKRFVLVKFALFATFRHFLTTLALILLFVAGLVLMAVFPLGVIVMPGVCLFIYSLLMERVLWKYMTEEMRQAWKEAEEEL